MVKTVPQYTRQVSDAAIQAKTGSRIRNGLLSWMRPVRWDESRRWQNTWLITMVKSLVGIPDGYTIVSVAFYEKGSRKAS